LKLTVVKVDTMSKSQAAMGFEKLAINGADRKRENNASRLKVF
jgi:hypothetical protein